ncbi:hypothetical protein H0G86_001530 [Trichoderma simmonsii]|uniref:Uncharacterized protein n=2 Tax=Trichoderma simmonsii TaxID=1491479 RepID=A0A8G0PCH6_9HYPO|nr:hypothetical protein Trihar35433_3034 [Trichoderma harzianum]QYS94184.1 hypothetical protein H0G86_001530 [Trichoderma simmonsii]
MSEFLGSRISLISKSDIRYVGTLHEINSDESTVSLENVRSFGTEGRRGRPEEEIAPSDQVYEYIVFRGSDVKDLRIEEHPAIKENKPPVMPDDPAIVGARARPGAQGPNQTAPAGAPPGAPGFPQHQYPPNQFYGGPPPPGSWGRGGPGPMAGPGFGNAPFPPGPPPPGWYPPPGQGFPPGPGGPGPWGNAPFPPGPGGPPGSEAPQGQRAAPELSATQESKPPVGPGADKSKGAPQTEPKSHAQAARQSSNAPAPPVESKPSVEEVKAVATTLASNGAAKATDASKAIPTGPKSNRVQPVLPLTGPASKPFNPPFAAEKASQAAPQSAAAGPSSVQDATSAARAAVALAMAQLSNTGGNAMDNLTTKVQEMRVNAIRGGSANRGRGRGGRPAKVEVPDADFDFAQSNAKFNKEDFVKEAVGGSPSNEAPAASATEGSETQDGTTPVAYNKSTSFFDNISSEAKERAENNGQKPGGREWRGEEQRRNIETFGQGSVDGGYRNYRGRGRGRGTRGGGRGFSRGGRGGPRPQYQSTAAGQ